MKRAVVAAFLLCASLSAVARAEPTRPDPRSAIVLITEPGGKLGLRLAAELELLGLRVIAIEPRTAADGSEEPPSRASLEAAARSGEAIAAMRTVPSGRGVEIWIADRVTGKTILREIVQDDGAADAETALAVHAVELLRASLLETTLAQAPRGEVAAPPEVTARLALAPPPRSSTPAAASLERPAVVRLALAPAASLERPAVLRLALAPAVIASAGGVGPSAALDVGASWMPSEHFGLAASVAVPLTRPSMARGANRVDLSALLAGGALRFAFAPHASTWSPTADIGVVVASLRSDGKPGPGVSDAPASTVAAGPVIGAGLAFAPTSRFRLRADAHAAWMTRRVSLDILSKEVATWGAPVLLAELGIDVGLF